MKPRSPNRSHLWPLLLMLAILSASGHTQLATPELGFDFSKDKLGHFLVFGLLATAFLRIDGLRKLGMGGVVLAALATACFGLLDEWRQSMTPGRQVEFADWLADATGAVVAVCVYHFWPLYRELLEHPLRPGSARSGQKE